MPLAATEKILSNANTGSSTIGGSPTRNIEIGEIFVLLLSERDWSISSVADNSSQAGSANTYTQDAVRATNDVFLYCYRCEVTKKILSSDTVTATFGGPNGGKSLLGLVLPDADPSGLDKTASVHVFGNASTYDSTSVASTTQPDEYAVGFAAYGGTATPAGTITADSPWTLQHSGQQDSNSYVYAGGSQVLTAVGTPGFTGAWGATLNSGEWAALIATYKGTVPASGGGLAWIRA